MYDLRWRMVSSGLLRRVALVRTDVSEEPGASFVHGGDYEECRLLGYKNPFRNSQETHYFSTTESSHLMLYKIWGFHGGDYEECRLLGYKNPIHTSQETHYVSATEPSKLMLCKIWDFNGGDYEACRLLGCSAVWLLKEPTFRRNLLFLRSVRRWYLRLMFLVHRFLLPWWWRR
jgi:hypothetical protein